MASAEYWIHFRARTGSTILRISVRQISRNLNTTRRLVNPFIHRWIRSEYNFENFTVRGRFWKIRKKSIFFQRLATSGRHNSALIIDRRKFITKWSLYMGSGVFRISEREGRPFPSLPLFSFSFTSPPLPSQRVCTEPGRQTHFGAIHSPKFANLLKFYPRAQNVHATFIWLFSEMQILSVF